MNRKIDYIVYSDGGARGNPGKAAYGFIIYSDDHQTIHSEGKFIGIATNNFAEYTGVLKALEYLSKNIRSKCANVHFYLDSKLVVEQLNGNYKIKNETLKNLFQQTKLYELKLDAKINYFHVPREQNKEADRLVNNALDREEQ